VDFEDFIFFKMLCAVVLLIIVMCGVAYDNIIINEY